MDKGKLNEKLLGDNRQTTDGNLLDPNYMNRQSKPMGKRDIKASKNSLIANNLVNVVQNQGNRMTYLDTLNAKEAQRMTMLDALNIEKEGTSLTKQPTGLETGIQQIMAEKTDQIMGESHIHHHKKGIDQAYNRATMIKKRPKWQLNENQQIDSNFYTIQLQRDKRGKYESSLYHHTEKGAELPPDSILQSMKQSTEKKLAICVTMYNEDQKELNYTMSGVYQNFEVLINKGALKAEDICVFMIADGIGGLTDNFLKFGTNKFFSPDDIKPYQKKCNHDGTMKMLQMEDLFKKDSPGYLGANNLIHTWETELSWNDFGLNYDKQYKGKCKFQEKIKFIFAVKQKNDGKINSHKWFYQYVCHQTNPSYCLMLDIGTLPTKGSIFRLYQYMSLNDDCGGCCGEIEVDMDAIPEGGAIGLCYSQYYEYKMGHTPDKTVESAFGFCSVLPGAYCVFRWEAISGDPLDEFYKGENKDEHDLFKANQFLAEDRILCLEIRIHKKKKYHLAYIPGCVAYTDPPDSFNQFVSQRRRWTNGAVFGTFDVIKHFDKMMPCSTQTTHNFGKKLLFMIFMCYYLLNFTLSFFSVGAMYATLCVLMKMKIEQLFVCYTSFSTDDQETYSGQFYSVLSGIYLAVIATITVTSLTIPIRQNFYILNLCSKISIVLFGIMFGLIVQQLVTSGFYNNGDDFGCPNWATEDTESTISWLNIAGFVILINFLVPFFRFGDFARNWYKYIFGLICYVLMYPGLVNVVQVYSMCNLHDISWGNRSSTEGSDRDKKKLEEKTMEYQQTRGTILIIWGILNVAYARTFIVLATASSTSAQYFLMGFSLFVAVLIAFKMLIAMYFSWSWIFYFRLKRDHFSWKKKDVEKMEQRQDKKQKKEEKKQEKAEQKK